MADTNGKNQQSHDDDKFERVVDHFLKTPPKPRTGKIGTEKEKPAQTD